MINVIRVDSEIRNVIISEAGIRLFAATIRLAGDKRQKGSDIYWHLTRATLEALKTYDRVFKDSHVPWLGFKAL